MWAVRRNAMPRSTLNLNSLLRMLCLSCMQDDTVPVLQLDTKCTCFQALGSYNLRFSKPSSLGSSFRTPLDLVHSGAGVRLM